ncbi:hypothetical protein HYY69_00740 [Candidatus Woesearchaeota archaeon]|nr:hypothetical protein [Candidatus Woesearchaeota archaeon]
MSIALSLDQTELLHGTSLEGMSLDQLLRNVEINNCWNQDTEEVIRIKEEVERMYHAAVEIYTRKRIVREIAQGYGLSQSTVESWRARRIIPRILRKYQRPYIPTTDEERISFAYLLGSFCYKHAGIQHLISPGINSLQYPVESIKRTFHDTRAAERFSKAFAAIRGKPPAKDRNTRETFDPMFVRAVTCQLECNFEKYVASDEERIAFLKGYFDAAPVIPLKRKTSMRISLQSEDDIGIDFLITAFFELDVYPIIENGYRVVVERYRDLERLYQLKIVAKTQQRKHLNAFLETAKPATYDVDTYYHVRRIVRRRKQKGEAIDFPQLRKQFGVDRVTLNSWVCDITGNRSYKKKEPRGVDSYLEALAWLKFPHVYETEQPVFRNEKLFIPVEDGRLFVVPRHAQQQYLKTYDVSDKDMMDINEAYHLREELERCLQGDKQCDINIKYDPKSCRVISITPNQNGSGRR